MTLLHFIRSRNILIEPHPMTGGVWLTWGTMQAAFGRRRKALEWCQWIREGKACHSQKKSKQP